MNYKETIDYLFTRLPMFSRIGAAAYKKDLTNTVALCNSLNNPQNRFKTIHVAGTNGKGSVSHMLAAVLQTAGYKTGLYTSPHLYDFRERIKVNGEMVSKDFVIDFTNRIHPQIEKIEPSFFEITVAMAFDYFAQQQVGIAVIETGLGGRLDSTNVITPELSVITNIGWDHMNILGDSLEKIAYEKAGIIKKNIPVVVGEMIAETKPVFEQRADEEKTQLFIAGEQFSITKSKTENNYLAVEVKGNLSGVKSKYQLDLPGFYQTKNILTVLTATEQLMKQGWKIEENHLQIAFKNSKQINGLHGRWETIQTNPSVILDVAHNQDGIKQIVQQLKQISYHKLHIIIGMVKDKEIDAVLALLPKDAAYYFTKAQIPRAMLETDLQIKSKQYNLIGEHYKEVNEALAAAKKKASTSDFILVCGSVFLVGEVTV